MTIDDGWQWRLPRRDETTRPLRVAFDVGGVLSKFPEIFRRLLHGLGPTVEIYVISDMSPRQAIVDALARNGLGWVPSGHIVSADYARLGETCKAEACKELEIDILIDDFMGYVSIPGAPLVRLLVMPDASLDYYATTWQTDGSEGSFGRRGRDSQA